MNSKIASALLALPLALALVAAGASYADTNPPRDAHGRFVKKAKKSEKFSCNGIGKGQHKKGMTEEDCVKAGGTVSH